MFVIALTSAVFIIAASRIIRAKRPVQIASWFLVAAEVVGVFPRAYVTNTGISNFVGPFNPGWIGPAMTMITAYNTLFGIGVVVGTLVFRFKKIEQPRFDTSIYPRKVLTPKSLLVTLIICSLPAIVLMFTHHHTFLNDRNISVDRGAVAGSGPMILIGSIPYTAMVIWYTYRNTRVTPIWLAILVLLFGFSLLGGSRSQTLDYILVLLAVRFLQTNRKINKRMVTYLAFLAVVLLYVGSIVSYARGMMRFYGGSLWKWAATALHLSPLQTWGHMLQSSFNGYDGLVSVVGTVPSTFRYHVGTLAYQMATILIPRSIWHTKWGVDLVAQFTHEVWGWGPSSGENFITGPGALYLDSGPLGVVIGAFLLGLFTSIFGSVYARSSAKDGWMKRIIFASWCFFLARFTFAGSPIDFDFAASIVIEALVVFLVSRPARYKVNGSRSVCNHQNTTDVSSA